jgi:hypothetical protein
MSGWPHGNPDTLCYDYFTIYSDLATERESRYIHSE